MSSPNPTMTQATSMKVSLSSMWGSSARAFNSVRLRDSEPKVNFFLLARPRVVTCRGWPACSGRANVEIVNRFLTSADTPVATIGTALLPKALTGSLRAGKVPCWRGPSAAAVLGQPSSRSFLAPYLERTYNVAVHRRMINQIVTNKLDERMRLDDMVLTLSKFAEDMLELDPDESHRQEHRGLAMMSLTTI